ncbi:hypothetical protein K0M31_004999 [Melipona bicolor]|uniref:Uncharacterized protein n=1 Tax=Melipona bicolor TaxID=60889 RepID=A0AA40FW53_9HYME|nr:hypothetical protein K0M31_004999 [Melipona bicolor]
MYDSVQVFAVGLRTLEQSHALRPANISCEMEHPWDGGLSLINYINSVSKEKEKIIPTTNRIISRRVASSTSSTEDVSPEWPED